MINDIALHWDIYKFIEILITCSIMNYDVLVCRYEDREFLLIYANFE